MKLQITHPTEKYQAGLIYEVPEAEALELIEKDFAYQVVEEVENISTLADDIPVFAKSKKKVNDGNR